MSTVIVQPVSSVGLQEAEQHASLQPDEHESALHYLNGTRGATRPHERSATKAQSGRVGVATERPNNAARKQVSRDDYYPDEWY
jgi:hypothetical protein